MAAARRNQPDFADLVCLGIIAGAHGVKGGIRVRSFTDDPADIGSYGELRDETGEKRFALKVTGMAKSHVLAELDGVNDRTQAEALKGVSLYVPRNRLPVAGSDEFYQGDLIGLKAALADGTDLGTVVSVQQYGAGDMVEIARDGEKGSVMVPFTRDVVPVVDLAAGRMVIAPPPGLLEPVPPEPKETGENK